MKLRKGFTLVEVAITLGILAIALALSGIAFSNLANIQTTATDQLVANRELTKVDDLVARYVSFVSVNTPGHSFSYDGSSSETKISFSLNAEYRYDLEYTDNSLSISTTYSGADDKLKISDSLKLEYVKSIKFTFDGSIDLLISEINYLSNKTIRYSYVVRALS